MSRGPRDSTYRRVFGERLRQLIEVEIQVPLSEMAVALGYQDVSTLRSAMAGRCGLDLDRLATLSAWTKKRNTPVNLHWLLAGEGSPLLEQTVFVPQVSSWLTPELHQALKVIADVVPSLRPPQKSEKA